ncbi:MAG: hypothetical protein AAF125_26750, partial [Chloroflexota bacterium]
AAAPFYSQPETAQILSDVIAAMSSSEWNASVQFAITDNSDVDCSGFCANDGSGGGDEVLVFGVVDNVEGNPPPAYRSQVASRFDFALIGVNARTSGWLCALELTLPYGGGTLSYDLKAATTLIGFNYVEYDLNDTIIRNGSNNKNYTPNVWHTDSIVLQPNTRRIVFGIYRGGGGSGAVDRGFLDDIRYA